MHVEGILLFIHVHAGKGGDPDRNSCENIVDCLGMTNPATQPADAAYEN
jgi:hypothetical protein